MGRCSALALGKGSTHRGLMCFAKVLYPYFPGTPLWPIPLTYTQVYAYTLCSYYALYPRRYHALVCYIPSAAGLQRCRLLHPVGANAAIYLGTLISLAGPTTCSYIHSSYVLSPSFILYSSLRNAQIHYDGTLTISSQVVGTPLFMPVIRDIFTSLPPLLSHLPVVAAWIEALLTVPVSPLVCAAGKSKTLRSFFHLNIALSGTLFPIDQHFLVSKVYF